jgi:ketosteroid isomerase-like protein
MKLGRVGILVCLGAWTLGPTVPTRAAAQAPAAPPAAAPSMATARPEAGEAEREALRQLRSVYEAAIRDNRVEALAPLLHDDFHGVMVTGRAVTGLAGLQQYWTDIRALMGEGGKYTTTLKPEASVFVGDLALARGTSDDVVVTGGGEEFRFTTAWTAVLQKVNGQWKIRQAQASMDPVNNAFTRTFTRRMLRWTMPLAVLAGLVVGFVGAKVLGRRKA